MTSPEHLLHKRPVDINKISLVEWKSFFNYIGISDETRRAIFSHVYFDGVSELRKIPGLTQEEYSILKDTITIPASGRYELLKSQDGSLRLTLKLHDGHLAETVIIPEWKDGVLHKVSASISSQIGCFFGCSFCATGRMGFHRNLSTGELLDQVRESERIIQQEFDCKMTHLYFMGMGEPMHNYSSLSDALAIISNETAPGPAISRITVSTVGLFRQIRMLADDHPGVRLAVSIHSADQQTRYEVMPVSARLGLEEIRHALIYYSRKTGHSVTIQYLLMKDVNDQKHDAENLVAYLGDINADITLIMYNNVSESGMSRTERNRWNTFQEVLMQAGYDVDTRWCYGEDIEAGCGQLKVLGDSDRVSMSMRHETGLHSGNTV